MTFGSNVETSPNLFAVGFESTEPFNIRLTNSFDSVIVVASLQED